MTVYDCSSCPFFDSCETCEKKDTCKTKPQIKSPGCCQRQTGWFAKSGTGKPCHYMEFANKLEEHIEDLQKEKDGISRALSSKYELLDKIKNYLNKTEVTCKHKCGKCKMWKREGVGAWGKCSVGSNNNLVHATDNVCLLYNILYDVGMLLDGKGWILKNIGE